MAPVTVLVTGASGFLGAHYVKYTHQHHPDWKIVAQVRSTPLGVTGENVFPLTADLTRASSAEVLASVEPDVVVHMAAAITEDNAREINAKMMGNVLAACQKAGAKLVYISSSQVNFERLNQYAKSKVDDEKAAADSGVPHTIIRPAAPFGPMLPEHTPAREQSMHAAVKFCSKLPAVPVMGDGKYTRQPVHVDEFNHAINHFIENDKFEGKAYDIGGDHPLSMNAIMHVLAGHAGNKVMLVHLPLQLFIFASNFVKTFNKDLLSTVTTNEVADNGPLLAELGKERFMPFEESSATLF